MAQVVERECTNCKATKSLEEFSNVANGKYGKSSRCKICIKLLSKKYCQTYYQKNREQLLLKQKQYNETNKDAIKNYQQNYYQTTTKQKIEEEKRNKNQSNPSDKQ